MRNWLIIPFLFAFYAGNAQLTCPDSTNLVLNPGFEDTLGCPQGQNSVYLAHYWNNATASSPDFFHTCSPQTFSGVHIPNNYWGYQDARTGNAYAGFAAFVSTMNNAREYIEGELTDSLIPQKKYCISFYISLAGTSNIACNNIGIYFSPTLQIVNTLTTLPFIPQFKDSIVRADTTAWMHVTGDFIATGGEKYFIIGNFSRDSLTNADTLYTFPNQSNAAYYYIDDVKVYCCDIDTGDTTATPSYRDITLTPSPNNGTMRLRGNFPPGTRIEIFNIFGQVVYYDELPEGNSQYILSIPTLTAGTYIYRVHANGVLLKREKFVVSNRE